VSQLIFLALAAAGLLIEGAAAAAQGMVVRADGPSADRFPAGTIIRPGEKLRLKRGDVITVAEGAGTRLLRGGLAETVTPDPSLLGRLRQVLAASREKRARLAGTRSTEKAGEAGNAGRVDHVEAAPSIWVINYREGGTWCVPSSDDVQLWKPGPRRDGELVISAEDGASRTIRWSAELETVAWPGGVSVREDESYLVAADGETPYPISFRVLEEVPVTVDDIARELDSRGCYSQLDLIGSTLAGW
jgi:hypothetical protein